MPINETKADIVRERALLNWYCPFSYPDAICVPTVKPALLPYDAIYTDSNGIPVLVADAKVRTNTASAYDTYMVSVEKFQQLVLRGIALSCAAILLVEWSCGTIGTYRITTPDGGRMKHWDACTVSIGGRTGRGQPSDIEPMIFIPMANFTILKEGSGHAK